MPRASHTRTPHGLSVGDRVANTRNHDESYAITGIVVAIAGRLVEVRIDRAVNREGGGAAPPGDGFRTPGSVIRSAGFLWRKLG